MSVMETVLILFSVSVSMSLVLGGVKRLADLEARRRKGFIIAALLIYPVMVFVRLPNVWLSNWVVIVAGIAGALVISSFNRSKGGVIAFLVTAAVVDWFSFSGGLTRWIIDSSSGGDSLLLQYLTVALPVGGRMRFLIGIGDLLITGAAGLSLFRLGYPAWRTYLILMFAVLFTVSVGLTFGGIPALPVIALVTGLYVTMQPVERSGS